MARTSKVHPQFVAVKIDESAYFESPAGKKLLKEAGGKIYSSHFYDQNLLVHIASLTGVYELHFIEYVPESTPDDDEDAREQLYTELIELQHDTEWVGYYDTSFIDGIKKKDKHVFPKEKIPEDDEEYNEMVEAMREYLQGNPVF